MILLNSSEQGLIFTWLPFSQLLVENISGKRSTHPLPECSVPPSPSACLPPPPLCQGAARLVSGSAHPPARTRSTSYLLNHPFSVILVLWFFQKKYNQEYKYKRPYPTTSTLSTSHLNLLNHLDSPNEHHPTGSQVLRHQRLGIAAQESCQDWWEDKK